jgi:glucose uptake protein
LVLPTTYVSVVGLLILSFFCLGSWPNTFKAAGPRWRFELFAIDFAIGALLLSVAAAYTFGSLGPELSFADRVLVASKTAQGLTVIAGGVLALGNLLLLAGVSLLGIAAAFPLSLSLAIAISSLLRITGTNLIFSIPGVLLMLGAANFAARAGRAKDPLASIGTRPPAKSANERKMRRRTARGIIVTTLSGLVLGFFYPILARGLMGDFGLGPYAGMLELCVSLLVSTAILNIYFMNIVIDAGPIGFRAYARGAPNKHFLGFAAGAIWALGILAVFLCMFAPLHADLRHPLLFTLPVTSVLLTIFWGLFRWREFTSASKSAESFIRFAAAFFFVGLVALALGFASYSESVAQ